MEIKIYQSGGFAGERIKLKEISDKQLTQQSKEKLKELLGGSEFYAQKTAAKEGVKPEGFDNDLQYEISVSDKKGEHKVVFQKTEGTKSLNELFDFLMKQ
jgi:hypothetical protein